MKKSFIAGLAGTLVLGLATSAFAFTDVTTSHWAKKYVDKLADLKVVNGVSETAFNPNGKVTRAEFAKMIVEAKGLAKENPATATFTDVAADKWYFGYVEAAAKAGYVNGTGEGKFAPNAMITRQEIAKIIVEAAGLKADAAKTLTFADAADVSEWAKGYVAVAADKKFVEGYNNKFSPKNNATRAEAAKLTYSEMVYEGKIIEEEVIAENEITKSLGASDSDVEIGGKLYSFEGTPVLKMAGKYVTDKTLFIKGTPVTVTFGDNNRVVILEGNPKFVEGKVEAKGANSDGRTVTVSGKVLTYVKVADEKGALQYANINLSSSYKFLLNKDGKVYAAVSSSATTKSGNVTSIGYKKVDSKDQYYLALDGTVYNLEEDKTPGASSVLTAIYVDGVVSTTTSAKDNAWDSIDTDFAATVELNADNEITLIKAYTEEVTGSTTALSNKYAKFVDIDGNTKWLKNLVQVGSAYIGKNTTESDAKSGRTEQTGTLILMVSSNATITDKGSKIDLDDVKSSKYATIKVNGEGIVSSVAITDNVVMGQVTALNENSDDELVDITIGGVKYEIDGDYTYTNTNANELKKALSFVKVDLTSAGEVKLFTVRDAVYKNTDDEAVTFTVIATPFEKGRPTPAQVLAGTTDDTYAPGGSIRYMDSDGNIYEVSLTGKDIVKANKDIKILDVKKNDTIAVAGTSPTPTSFSRVIVNPIVK